MTLLPGKGHSRPDRFATFGCQGPLLERILPPLIVSQKRTSVVIMLAQKHARGACNIVPTLMFKVRWDVDRREYVALDTAGALLGASSDENEAIGSACREASKTSRAGVRVLVTVQSDDGRMRHEWTAEPPP
jgi:hypothetical protein